MPKKFGTNTKSQEARDRRNAQKEAEKSRKEQEAEDALWEDNDKNVAKKMQRKDDKEKRKLESLSRKAENKAMLEEEMSTLKGAKAPTAKVTRADIAATLEKNANEEKQPKVVVHTDIPLEENVNRLAVDGDEARTVDDAIAILNDSNEKVDRHPERRMKAAYEAFEQDNLPRLKAENPNMRLSQLKQLLKKEWMKSPINPMNQAYQRLNAKKN